ncbi:MAG: hypothetical protein KAI84_01160 [Gammaproteobacteria bacterium]|nr:hypothetical protein [Gammaproteobacteria bacterium]
MTQRIYFKVLVLLFLAATLVSMRWTESCIQAEDTSKEVTTNSRVLVETDKQEYQKGEEIIVTITNNLDTSITTFDQHAFCSIIRLEQQSETEWKEVQNCFSGAPIQLITLKSGTQTVVKLPGLSPGIYRVSLVFSLGETFHFGDSFVASSPPFRVQ